MTIPLNVNDVVVCIYQNNQQLGAIKVFKNAKNKNCSTASPPDGCSSGNAPLAGAKFEIWQESNGCLGLQTASVTCLDGGTNNNTTVLADTKVKSEQSTVISGSGASTVASTCFSDLSFADNYYVHESSAPSGYYAAGDQTAGISANSTCSSSPVTKTFTDTPKTDLSVTVGSEVTGVTNSRIACVDSGSTNIGNSPQPADTGTPPVQNFGDPETVTANGLRPGTYTCIVRAAQAALSVLTERGSAPKRGSMSAGT